MGQGFKVYSSSELYCKWPKVAETMTEANLTQIKGSFSLSLGDSLRFSELPPFPDIQIFPEFLGVVLLGLSFIKAIEGNHSTLGNWQLFHQSIAWSLLAAFGLRVLWNSALLIHGFGHCLIRMLVDQNTAAFTLASILENRTLAEVVRSCIPLQRIVLPSRDSQNLPWIAVGDRTPWKVRSKAMGGMFFNSLAVGWASLCYVSLFPLLSGSPHGLWANVLALAIPAFAIANAIILVCSVSDAVAIVSGRADYFYCGNFGFIAQKTDPQLEGLIPQSWLELFKAMGRETEVRGEQAGGGLTIAQDWSGRSYFVGDKIVNAKRSNLTQSLEKVFHGTRDRAWRAGYRPRYNTITGVWHYRFGTSGPPSVLETHWHEWSPDRLEKVWQIENGTYTAKLKNVNHRITHNGDFDAWHLFGRLIDYQTLGLWLERVLQVPNQTVGDSPKIAGMMDLLITQGMWLASVRLAYQLMMASSVADAFGGAELTKDAPNTAPARDQLERWARLCEAAFVEHLNHLPEVKELTTATSLYQLQQLMIHNLQQDHQLASIDNCKLCLFVQATLEGFLHNDLYRATQFFMLRARGSFGLGC